MKNESGEVSVEITDWDVEDKGVEHPDYWQGAGVSHTKWTEVFVGTGSSAREAFDDALKQLSGQTDDQNDIPHDLISFGKKLSNKPDAEDEQQHYVAIYIKGEQHQKGESKMDKSTSVLKVCEEVMGVAMPAEIKGSETVIFKAGTEYEGMMGSIASVEKDGKVGVMLGKAGPFIVEPSSLLLVDYQKAFGHAPVATPTAQAAV